MNEQTLYRQLFLKRYLKLIEKTEKVYSLSKDDVDYLKTRMLNLDWIDVAVNRVIAKDQPQN
jgi:hypothetical protein